MSETKFTKGEWIICDGDGFGCEIIITTRSRLEERKGEICGIDVDFDGARGVEQKANTHLIAAAPDMYEALSGLAELGLDDDCKINTDELKKLLAKARGEV